jgi:hypothetical protein
VVPILLIVVFGIIDFGAVFNNYLVARHGTREGARQSVVSTTPLPPGGGSWNSTNCQTNGIPTSGDGYDLVCFTKDRIGLDESKPVGYKYAVPDGPPNAGHSLSGDVWPPLGRSPSPEARLGVCIVCAWQG